MNDEDTKVFLFENELEEETATKEVPEEESFTTEEVKEEGKGKKNKAKKDKVSLKEKWKNLSKKKKILFIVVLVLIILGITIGTILILKKNKKPEKKEKVVVIENKNYRYENGTLVFYDNNKKDIGKYECKNKSEKKCYLAYYNSDDLIDNTKYTYEDDTEVLFQTPVISKRYVFIYDNASKKDEIITLYDIKEKKKKEIYTNVKKAFNDYVYIVKNSEGKYGVISLKDDLATIVKFKYDFLGYYDASNNEYLVASVDEKYIIIDKDENERSKPIKGKICGYTNDYIKVKNDTSYILYDYNGNVLLDNGYTFITFADKYIAAVNGDILYIFDNKTKLNYDGIKLYNDNYIRKYVYDKKNKLIEIINSFDVSKEGNEIVIKVYNEKEETTTKINILEAMVNSKLEYISYSAGKLYFYSDSEKQNLIGTYNCKNKNTISSVDSTLTNCKVAKEKDNYIPVINERFAFISDTLDPSKENINLYDLKDNKTLTSYLEIDSSISTGNRFYTTSDLNIIALSSKKNKYGVINIGNDKVKQLLEASYDKITKKDDYYIVSKASGTYSVFDFKGTSLTSEFGNEIYSYNAGTNFVMTTSNGKYKLFKASGQEITKKFYNNIDVYSSYIVGIDGKKLDVLKYDGSVYCDSCKDITIYNTDYDSAYNIDSEKITIYKGTEALDPIYFKEQSNGEE